MKNIFFAVCCVAFCCVLATGQKHGSKGGGAGMTDQQFVNFAAQTDMMEANLGQLAGSNASSSSVKQYAQGLVTDHTNDYGQLGSVAGKASLTEPKGLDASHQRMIAPFQKLKGAAFDRRYLQEMITGHTQALAVYKKEAARAKNADLKAYASQTLPTLEKHLDGAKDLAKSPKSKK